MMDWVFLKTAYALPVSARLGTSRGWGDNAKQEMWLMVELPGGNVIEFDDLEKSKNALIQASNALDKALKREGASIGHRGKPYLTGNKTFERALRIDKGKKPPAAKQRWAPAVGGGFDGFDGLSALINHALYKSGIKRPSGW